MSTETTNANEELTFEIRLERLQKIINALEQGNTSLNDGLNLYKEGILHAKECQELIQKAQHEIKILQENELKDFKAL